MNLHAMARGAISAVNPFTIASIRVATGAMTTSTDGTRTPSYAPAVPVSCQVQPMSAGDLRQTDGLNIQGIKRKIFLSGRVDGLIRENGKGGDLITMCNGDVYLVALVLEYWPDWCSVAVTLQNRK